MAPHTPTPDDNTSPGARSATGGGASELADFAIDLTHHEVLRRAHVMEALGPHWDPIEALQGEEAAHDLLYSGLDPQQQRLYNELVAAGILPARGHRAAP
ncbi:DUF6400 family protein [Streptomyces sp. NRRL F-4474]|uniref:DUF6400 family protein n=1 Tax=Streptomyces sp. NRRL F-4474 TaxID=1463851 RepID=UPI000A70EAFA|nr:DUF6400 family protein [Streptomyces sp. NRRL F-4474]